LSTCAESFSRSSASGRAAVADPSGAFSVLAVWFGLLRLWAQPPSTNAPIKTKLHILFIDLSPFASTLALGGWIPILNGGFAAIVSCWICYAGLDLARNCI
jgi:hypothetical protein